MASAWTGHCPYVATRVLYSLIPATVQATALVIISSTGSLALHPLVLEGPSRSTGVFLGFNTLT